MKEEGLDRRPELFLYVPVPCGYNKISHHTAEDYTAFCEANMLKNITGMLTRLNWRQLAEHYVCAGHLRKENQSTTVSAKW